MIGSAYLAAEGFEADLAEDLRRAGARIGAWHGRLALSPDAPVAAPWALEAWTDPREIPVPSVKAGLMRCAPSSATGHITRCCIIGARRCWPIACRR